MSIDFTVAERIATIVINRPERLNALDLEHYRDLSAAWREVRDNDDIRAAIVTGAGAKAFCVGADLKSFVGRDQKRRELWRTQKDQLLNRGLEVLKPVVAAVNGLCHGGGVTLLLSTDIRLCAPNAEFTLPEVKRGIIAANGGTQRLVRQLPRAIAMEMLLLGKTLTAERARHFGLVNDIVPAAELMDRAHEVASRLAANPPLAVQAAKELALQSQEADISRGLRLEQFINEILRSSDDSQAARAAFAEGRAATFEGN
jgi:E-phenylitaconyl-CoA hydratase